MTFFRQFAPAIGIFLACGGLSGGTPEYAVKAAYLYNFTRFVEWPEDSLRRTLTMCIYGKSPVSGFLEDAVHGKFTDRGPISVRRLSEGDDNWQSCHLIFFASIKPSKLHAVLNELKGHCILTVGESEAFAEDGGMITLVVEGDRIRFDVNLDAAREAHLNVSSRLAALSRLPRASK